MQKCCGPGPRNSFWNSWSPPGLAASRAGPLAVSTGSLHTMKPVELIRIKGNCWARAGGRIRGVRIPDLEFGGVQGLANVVKLFLPLADGHWNLVRCCGKGQCRQRMQKACILRFACFAMVVPLPQQRQHCSVGHLEVCPGQCLACTLFIPGSGGRHGST